MEKVRVGIPWYDESLLGRATYKPEILNVTNLIAEPLIRLYDGKVWPALARSWQVFDHGKRWLFYLLPNVLFSDSTPCTMADVVDAINYVREGKDDFGQPTPFGRYLEKYQFNILNRYALEAVTEEPSGDLAEILSAIPILKPNRFGKRVIGTGNYKYANYQENKSVRLVKQTGLKHLSAYEQITFFILPDPMERLNALRKGEIHLAASLDAIPENEKDAELVWWNCTSSHIIFGLLNAFRAPFNSANARRAVNLAVNKQEIINCVLHGNAKPASSIVSPYHCGYNSMLDPIPYDPALARRLFAQENIDHEIVIAAAENFFYRAFDVAEKIAQYLMDVGVPARVERFADTEDYLRHVGEGGLADIMLMLTTNGSTYRILHDNISCRVKGSYWQGIEDEAVEKMIREANAETDLTERERKYSAAVAYLNRNPHWLYLYHPVSVFAWNSELRDIETLHSGVLRFPGAW